MPVHFPIQYDADKLHSNGASLFFSPPPLRSLLSLDSPLYTHISIKGKFSCYFYNRNSLGKISEFEETGATQKQNTPQAL